MGNIENDHNGDAEDEYIATDGHSEYIERYLCVNILMVNLLRHAREISDRD